MIAPDAAELLSLHRFDVAQAAYGKPFEAPGQRMWSVTLPRIAAIVGGEDRITPRPGLSRWVQGQTCSTSDYRCLDRSVYYIRVGEANERVV